MKRYARVIVPVADLRREKLSLTQDFTHNDFRESQLIYGERVEIVREEDEWIYIQALEQPRYSQAQQWHSYPGWLLKDEVCILEDEYQPTHIVKYTLCPVYKNPSVTSEPFMSLSLGSFIKSTGIEDGFIKIETNKGPGFLSMAHIKEMPNKIDETVLRNNICFTALRFLKTPYLWGGRAFYQKTSPVAGVDCSGLINLLFRSEGVIIPRDAHDQFLISKKLEKDELLPGDLIFFKRSTEARIHHVMLYMGRNNILESPFTGEKVRLIDLDKRIEKNKTVLYGRIIGEI